MANRKITECTELTTAPAADDVIAIVDISDTTDAASGTTKKQQWLNAIKWMFGSRFAEDAGANDTYTATLVPAPVAYITGEHYRFKANTANTGACTINFNGLGAKAIKKAAGGITTDLADNDIRAGQWVDLIYDGTNMQMQSLLGNAPAGGSGGIGDVVGPASATDLAIARYDSTTGKLIQDSDVTIDDDGAITVPEIAAPATPAAGKVSIYAKADGKLYIKDDAGTETDLTATGGGGGAGSITVAHLGSDSTNSTVTPAKITALDVTLGAGTYKFQYMIRYQAAATSTGIKFSVNFTGTQTAFMDVLRYTTPATTSVSDTAAQDVSGANGSLYQAWARRAPSNTANMGPTANTGDANADFLWIIEGLIVVTVSGNLELWHASEVAADTTVKTGTSLIVTQIA